jgi:hypothetical protein
MLTFVPDVRELLLVDLSRVHVLLDRSGRWKESERFSVSLRRVLGSVEEVGLTDKAEDFDVRLLTNSEGSVHRLK